MKLLNRIAISVTPLQPYADWVSQLPESVTEEPVPISLEEHQSENRVYLLEESDQELAELIENEECWVALFENELGAWDEFGDHWPKLSLALFYQWFDLKLLPVVFDQANSTLMAAELNDS